MASPAADQSCFLYVRKVGYLRKPKSMHKRFFVLWAASSAGPSRLEYYENEKKWRHKSGVPKRSIPLESCFNINKRADSKNKYLVALYTKDECFSIAAESEQEQDLWYQAMVDLHNRGKVHDGVGGGDGMAEENYGDATTPGPAFKEVWQVILKPKGLGHTKNLTGIYRLCLTNKTISFVKLNSDAAAVVLQLMNIRRCGHSENFFFIEVGRSAVTGPGEFWMQVDDSVVAQNMHETILEAMKAMSEEFRPRSKSQSSSNCSNPISVPLRRHHHNNPPPSQVGLGRRSRAESVTVGSPAGPKHSSSFRVRASSDGEGTMSRPASVDGSPSSPSVARTQSNRHRGGASRLHPPLNHSRSIPMPSSRCSPSAVSPVSLSSSSTSGHGSTSDCLFPRRSSASISGSPSDGGFISSDEYGSSPCDFRSSFRSVTPDSLGHTPPAREEELNNYIVMAKPGTPGGGSVHSGRSSHQSRGNTPSSSSRLDEPELEKSIRKRTHSSETPPPPPSVSHQKTSSTASLEEQYTVMMPSGYSSCSRTNSHRQSAFLPTHSYPEEGLVLPADQNQGSKDDGYMPMSPGVVPVSKSADYMSMSPKSISAPQQIINPRLHPRMDSNGYMMMSPSGSCSPDASNFGKIWTNGVNPKLSVESAEGKVSSSSCGDYMNMSPASCSTTSTPPDCYFNPVDEPPRPPTHAYFSLPRSFKHAHRKTDQGTTSSQRLLSISSGRLAFADSSSSSSTSSDSLGGGQGQASVRPKRTDNDRLGLSRPTRLSLEAQRASTLPRSREGPPFPPEPKSPGEYVNIEFNDKAFDKTFFSASLASLFPSERLSSFSGSGLESLEKQAQLSNSEYMNMHLGGAQSRTPGHTAKPPPCTDDYAIVDTSAPNSSSVIDSVHGRDYATLSCPDYSDRQLGSNISDYSDTPMTLNTTSASAINVPPSSASLSQDLSVLGAGPSAAHCGLIVGPLSAHSAFTRVGSSGSGWTQQGAKVIRADQQGRRRHSSETFSSSSSSSAGAKGSVSSSSASAEEVKRHSCASFENVWLRLGEVGQGGGSEREESLAAAGSRTEPPDLNQNSGLNYIDLDLTVDQNPQPWSSSQLRAGGGEAQQGGGVGLEEMSSYASISFQKEEETRDDPSHREE